MISSFGVVLLVLRLVVSRVLVQRFSGSRSYISAFVLFHFVISLISNLVIYDYFCIFKCLFFVKFLGWVVAMVLPLKG